MLHKYHISYAYSGKLWLFQNEEQKKNNGNYLAFAPSYNSTSSTERSLGALECNDEEVVAISTMWKGKKYDWKKCS